MTVRPGAQGSHRWNHEISVHPRGKDPKSHTYNKYSMHSIQNEIKPIAAKDDTQWNQTKENKWREKK